MGSQESKGEVIALGIVFAVAPILAIALRLYSRRIVRAAYGLDDYLIIPAAFFAIATAVTIIVGACIGELGQHQKQVFDSHGQLVHDKGLEHYEKCKLATQVLSIVAIGCAKLSLVFFYRRIFSTKTYRKIADCYLVFITCWTIAFVFATIFQCIPVSTTWTEFEYLYGSKCFKVLPFYYTFQVTDAVSDLAILILPLPMLWRLQMPTRQKTAVGLMLLLGALIIAISWTRLGIYVSVGKQLMQHFNDVVYYTTSTLYWSSIESSLSVLCACLPTMRPLFSSKIRHSRDRSYTSNPSKSYYVPGWRSKARRLEEGELESLHSVTNLRKDNLHSTNVSVDTRVTAVPLELLQQPEASHPGIWVQKELSRTGSRQVQNRF